MDKFELGDRVERITKGVYGEVGDIGTIVNLESEYDCVVRWDTYVGGWGDETFNIPEGYGTYVSFEDLKLIKNTEETNENIVVTPTEIKFKDRKNVKLTK